MKNKITDHNHNLLKEPNQSSIMRTLWSFWVMVMNSLHKTPLP